MHLHTDHAIASRTILSYASSRWAAVRSFESFTPSRSNPSGRITAAAKSGPATPPRPASSTQAIRLNPCSRRPRSNRARSTAPGPGVRATFASLTALPPLMHPSRPRGRPDHHERTPDHLVDGDEPEAPAGVIRVSPVVAHHEQRVARDLNGAEVAHRHPRLAREVRLLERTTVDIHDGVPDLERLAGKPDHPLDEVLVLGPGDPDALGQPVQEPADHAAVGTSPVLGIGEHDDVPAFRLVQDLVDQDSIARFEDRLHRAGRNEERLDNEGLEQDRQREGKDDENGKLSQERQNGLATGWAPARRLVRRLASLRRSGRPGRADRPVRHLLALLRALAALAAGSRSRGLELRITIGNAPCRDGGLIGSLLGDLDRIWLSGTVVRRGGATRLGRRDRCQLLVAEPALADPRLLPPTLTQVIELCATNATAGDHFQLADRW